MSLNTPSRKATVMASTHSPHRRPGGTGPRLTRRAGLLGLLVAVTGSLLLGAALPADGERERTRSPYTGEPAATGPVLAVKVDNSGNARPHTGLEQADLVYVEKVEAGLSRLMAVYASEQPRAVGPVRSARESDLELLRQFDRPALAYSGVQTKLREHIEAAPVYAVPQEGNPEPYFRGDERSAPHNLFVEPDKVLERAPKASHSADIGLRFGPAPGGGQPARERSVRYDKAETSFAWSREEDRWLTSFDGEPAMSTTGRQLGAKTVVIQHVTMRDSDFGDSTGAVTPYIETVGGGRATVLRDGKAYQTRWERPSEEAGTTYTLPGGERMPFDRGQVWVVYADR